MVKMPVVSTTVQNECLGFVKTLQNNNFTPVMLSNGVRHQAIMTSRTHTKTTTRSSSRHANRPTSKTTTTTTAVIPNGISSSTSSSLSSSPQSCRQCLHMHSQLNSLRQKLRSAHAAYTASHCQDERTFAHIPMLTVRSYRPHRRPVTSSTHRQHVRLRSARHNTAVVMSSSSSSSSSSVDDDSSLKLEVRRNEPVNALFMADDKWVYVKTSDERRGFIPAKCCQPFAVFALDSHANHYCKSDQKQSSSSSSTASSSSSSSSSSSNSETIIHQMATSRPQQQMAPSPPSQHLFEPPTSHLKPARSNFNQKLAELAVDYENEEPDTSDPNDLSLFSVSYLDFSNAAAVAAATASSAAAGDEKFIPVYDNLNEFKSSSSASSSSSSEASHSDHDLNPYAYLSDELSAATISASLRKCKKRKRASLLLTKSNPYDTLRRCHRFATTPSTLGSIYQEQDGQQSTTTRRSRAVKLASMAEMHASPKFTIANKMTNLAAAVPDEAEKKATTASKEKMLLMRIYKKLRASEAAVAAAATVAASRVIKDEPDGDYENLDDLMTAAAVLRPSKIPPTEHIYCNMEFF